MKQLAAISAIVFSVAALFSVMIHVMNADARQAREDAQKWLEFSMQHHCRVSKPSTFNDGFTTWQCDGFEVRR